MRIILFAAFLGLSGCATKLTSEAQQVQILDEPYIGCVHLGEITNGDRWLGNYKNIKNKLKNRAAEMGANVLVIERVTRYTFEAIAKVYKCSENQNVSAATEDRS